MSFPEGSPTSGVAQTTELHDFQVHKSSVVANAQHISNIIQLCHACVVAVLSPSLCCSHLAVLAPAMAGPADPVTIMMPDSILTASRSTEELGVSSSH